MLMDQYNQISYGGVISWKVFPLFWSFVRQSLADWWITSHGSSNVGLYFDTFFLLAWTISWIISRVVGDLLRHAAYKTSL